jgi:hypothetical protein
VVRLAQSMFLAAATLLLAACGGAHSQPASPSITTSVANAPLTVTSAPTQALAQTAQLTATRARPTPSVVPSRAASTAVAPVSTATATPVPSPTATATPEACPGAIAWDQAAAHVGQVVTVQGPVMGGTFASESRGQPTFLDIGRAYPDPTRFSVVIWIPNRANFSAPPEELYSGQTICVTGQVTLYNGSAEMEIIGPEDIQTT